MGDFVFRKVLDLGDIPPSWSLVRLAADWNDFPILLFVEGKPPRPDPETVSADPVDLYPLVPNATKGTSCDAF